MKQLKRVTFYISDEQHLKLKIAAAKSCKSQSEIVNTLLEQRSEQQLIEISAVEISAVNNSTFIDKK